MVVVGHVLNSNYLKMERKIEDIERRMKGKKKVAGEELHAVEKAEDEVLVSMLITT